MSEISGDDCGLAAGSSGGWEYGPGEDGSSLMRFKGGGAEPPWRGWGGRGNGAAKSALSCSSVLNGTSSSSAWS